jgi:hypothetical protein
MAIEKPDNHAEKISACFRLPQNIIHRILSLGSSPLNQSAPEANFLHFFWNYTVSRDVIDSVLWPDESMNPHFRSLA